MKFRLPLLIGAAALCTLALFAVYCTSLDPSNPLDEDGSKDHMVWKIKTEDCRDLPGPDGNPLGEGCVEYIRNHYFDTNTPKATKDAWDAKLNCAGKNDPLTINFVGPKDITLNHTETARFQNLMNPAQGVAVTYTTGASVEAVLKNATGNTIEYTGTMPPIGSYKITYTVTKEKCGGDEGEMLEPYSIDRNVTIVQQTVAGQRPSISGAVNTTIELESQGSTKPFTINPPNINYNPDCVLNSNGSGTCSDNRNSLNATVTKGSNNEPWTVKPNVGIGDTGTYAIKYKICGWYIPSAGAQETYACDSALVTVTVKMTSGPTNDPKAVIVFSKYSYNNIDGKPFTSPDTAFKVGGTFREPSGNITAYYMNGTNKVNITDVTLGGNLTFTNGIPPSVMGTPNSSGYNVTYTLAAGTGYASAEAIRKVYLTVDGECEGTPTVSFRTRSQNASGGWVNDPVNTFTTLTISSNAIPSKTFLPWWGATDNNVISASFTISARGGGDDNPSVNAYKLGIYSDSPKLDLDNPTSGNYTITYVGLPLCAGGNNPNGLRLFGSQTRTVTVQP